MVLKSSRFLTSSFIPEIPTFNNNHEEEEFNECDVVWSSTLEQPHPPTSTTTTTTATTTTVELPPISPTAATAGLSTALFDPQSPTSVQRKTTSSPVSMISSSLGRGDGPGLGGSYYGRRFNQSAPVNVPIWPNGFKSGPGFGLPRFDEVDDDGEYEEEDGGEMVPPHEIVARSYGATSFSVYEGAGRTLKGRDLTRVRNAVFQKTGFIE